MINLDHRQDRLREMKAQLGRLGLGFDDVAVVRRSAWRFADPAGFPNVGARGCFASHLSILRDALAAERPAVLVMEDDLDFTPDADILIPAALQALAGTDWAIFYGGLLGHDGGSSGSPIGRTTPGSKIVASHFVAFRRTAIVRLVPYLEAILARPAGHPDGGPMHVDGAYNHFRADHPELETWIANPLLGDQRASRTDIHQLRIYDRLPLVREAAATARRLKRRLA